MSGVGSGRNPVKDRACNCQILLKTRRSLGEKMKDGMKKGEKPG
jgi:hypothetical protein